VRIPCWAKPIITHNAKKNRLPASTGRAEVTVLSCENFRPRFLQELEAIEFLDEKAAQFLRWKSSKREKIASKK
jgi:hypothetical protein